MPWRHTSPLDQKIQFTADDLRATLSITELCQLYHISRKTAYQWLDRYVKDGPAGLEERSRKPGACPRQTPDAVVAAILEARRHHPTWGATKLLAILTTRHPPWPWPARSTVCDILSRNGLVPRRRRRRLIGHPGTPSTSMSAPKQIWTADFKGHFKTGDGLYGYPLTGADGYRRFLLAGQALHSTAVHEAKPVFTRLFQAFGLPHRIRTDNGVPFATHTVARLSPLSAWWVRLGILPECIQPGKPQQNGRHERRHRTLKAETPRPPAANRRAQQQRVNRFREEFNHQRPHEALDMRTPAACYEPSPRKMPHQLPPLEYPDRFEGRYVRANGGIRWHHQWVNVSHTCVGEYVGLEDIDDGVWTVSCGPLKLGRLLERHRRSEDAYGKLTRHR
jgi:putative transposase